MVAWMMVPVEVERSVRILFIYICEWEDRKNEGWFLDVWLEHLGGVIYWDEEVKEECLERKIASKILAFSYALFYL